MKTYKDTNNQLHVIEESFVHLLPVGSVQITDEEAEAIRIAAIPAAPKVTSVTMRQARLALLQAGLLSSVQTALQNIPDESQKQIALIEWEFAATVDRASQFTQSLAGSLCLMEDDLDNLFQTASEL